MDKINAYISLLLACTSILSMSLLSSKLKTFISESPTTEKLHLKAVSHYEI
jgi:cellobiose-specific phosphotransferase system component IIB